VFLGCSKALSTQHNPENPRPLLNDVPRGRGFGGNSKTKPWTYAVSLLIVSKFDNSQAAAISAMVPLALSIDDPTGHVVAFAAACYGYYILPTYPSDLATIQFDRSVTTGIGKYVVNHSFILPGMIGVSSSCIVGFLLAGVRGLL